MLESVSNNRNGSGSGGTRTKKSSLNIVKKKQPLKMNEKSLVNITDINVSKSKDALKHFTKINNMFKDATKSDKNMNDILQGIQMQNKIPDFIKK